MHFTWCLGRPTMEGKTARGASSPANPALHIPDPLSTTSAAISSSMAQLQRGKKKFKYHIHFQLPLQWAHFLLVDCSWTNCPLGGANTQHSDYQTKGSSAASHHYHIRTCFVLEQLCGYRRHGALPSTSITNLIHNDPALSDHSRYFTKQASSSSSDSVALSICLYS